MADLSVLSTSGTVLQEWSFSNGPFKVQNDNNSDTGTYVIVQFKRSGPVYVALWGQGTTSARGAYMRSNEVTVDSTKYYVIAVGAGRGFAGTSYGWVGRENGGGYTGFFERSTLGNSVSQSGALLIAGGAGGTGYGHGSSSGGVGGTLNGGVGTTSSDSEIGSTGGGGGTSTNGGGGGGGGGQQGFALVGGRGGDGVLGGYPNAGGGGGGGGGYYGGGGGGGGSAFVSGSNYPWGTDIYTSGTGGGGSGYVNTSKVTAPSGTSSFSGATDPNRGTAGNASGGRGSADNAKVVIRLPA